jgi:hypothetical protein
VTVSPEATGQAGAFFEQHVDAAFLSFLLVRGAAPFLPRCELVDVHLQSGHLGWKTDDLLAVGLGIDGQRRNAALQVKRKFVLARSNADCVGVFNKAWDDFTSAHFTKGIDVIGLVIGPSSLRLQRGLRILLSTARASVDGADLLRRLSLPNYRDKVSLEFAKTVREIVEGRNNKPVSDDEFIDFLRHFDFACLDLNTHSGVTEALILSFLKACAGPDGTTSTARNTWNELLRIAGRDSQDAGSFDHATLIAELSDLFTSTGAVPSSGLENLAEMTRTVRAGVDSDVVGYHIRRAALEQKTIEALALHQVLVLTGHAGSGKSAIAKAAFDACSSSDVSIAMRAGMLGRAHLAESLFSQELTVRRLREISALDGDKLIWIESGERLLEKPASERHAFHDLLRLIKEDNNWRILITCRTYSAETFRSAFLEGLSRPSAVLDVPPLTETELDELAEARPSLTRPLAHPRLRSLLSNPFILAKAALMDWQDGRDLPVTKRAFRRRVWREIIRRDDEAADGMPLRRGNCYLQLAKRRAQGLTSFVAVDGLDASALQKLKIDSVAQESPVTNNLWAPAHDVLEDWALLEWLDLEHARADGAWLTFFTVIETHPATRRALRMWFSERVDDNGPSGMDLAGLLCDDSIPAHWKDDALVAVLNCSAPALLLADNSELLRSNNATLLHRALHLVRVACKAAPAESSGAKSSVAFVPAGPAWSALADFAAEALDELMPESESLLAGFAEDWARGVTTSHPYPAGSQAIGRIVARLLEGRDMSRRYGSDPTERLLRIALQIPRHTEAQISALVDQCATSERLRSEDLFLRQVVNFFYSGPLCRDYPELVIRVLRRVLRPDKKRERPDGFFGHSASRMDIEETFGMPKALHHLDMAASAYGGPFLHLLRCHHGSGLGFVAEFVNRATAAYLRPENADRHGQIREVCIRLPDGSQVSHQGDVRLWNMYRISRGPQLVRSALMALEKYLLELGEQHPEVLQIALQRLMKEARSVAITSVVASAAMAYHEHCGDTVLPLLEARTVLDWDRGRYVHDQSNSDKIFATAFPAATGEESLRKHERSEAGEQPHRQQHLGLLALKLQRTDMRDRIWAIIDRHKEALPPPAEQSHDDKLWRLQLHRLDLRTFEAVDVNHDTGAVTFQSSEPAPDLAAVVEANRPFAEASERAAAQRMWATSRYEYKNEAEYSPEAWREHLATARTQGDRPAAWPLDSRLLIAVVCCRDSFDAMNTDERQWCIATIASAFAPAHSDPADPTAMGVGLLGGLQEAALELAGFLNLPLSQEGRTRLEAALTRALLADEHELERRAAAGIGRHLWKADKPLALSFVNGLMTHAQRVHDAAQLRPGWHAPTEAHGEDTQLQYEQALDAAIEEAILLVATRHAIDASGLRRDYRARPWCFVVQSLMEVLKEQSHDELALAFFDGLAQQLRASWNRERALGSSHSGRDDHHFDHTSERLIVSALTHFCLGLSPKAAVQLMSRFSQVAHEHADKVAHLAKELAYAEDRVGSLDAFWAVWRMLSDSLTEAFDQARDQREVAKVLFLNLRWNETTIEWAPLRGREPAFSATYKSLPSSSAATEAFVSFIKKVGSALMPATLPLLAEKLSAHTLSVNTLYHLELILAEFVYAGEPRIRREPELRDATLSVLDIMIDAGSSLAFRLRDDFVTPLHR